MGIMHEKIKANAKKTVETETTTQEIPTMTESTVLELTELATAIIATDLAEKIEDVVNPVAGLHAMLAKKQVLSLNNMKATSRSISKSPEEWTLALDMLEALVGNPILRREEPDMAAAARRMTTLHYPRGAGEFVLNFNALANKILRIAETIVKSGKGIPEVLVLHWDCDPKGSYYTNNKAEYQLLSRLTERYDYYSAKIDNGATNARPDSPAGAEARAEDRATEREEQWDHMHTSKLDGSLLDERI